MPIKRYIFVIFLTVSYLINTVLVSFEDLGFFLSTKKNARDASALNCLRAAPIAQKFSPERKLKVFLSKKRQSVPYIVPWPQENEKYNKMKKTKFWTWRLRPWAFLRNHSWLSSHPAWSKSTSTGMDRGKINSYKTIFTRVSRGNL